MGPGRCWWGSVLAEGLPDQGSTAEIPLAGGEGRVAQALQMSRLGQEQGPVDLIEGQMFEQALL